MAKKHKESKGKSSAKPSNHPSTPTATPSTNSSGTWLYMVILVAVSGAICATVLSSELSSLFAMLLSSVSAPPNSTVQQDTTGSVDQEPVKSPQELPDEIKNFNSTYLKKLNPKKQFIDGRRVPPIELLPQKEHNSSVRVFIFEEFMSAFECDKLREVHDSHVTQMSDHVPLVCFDSIKTLRKHLKTAKQEIHVTPQDFLSGTLCVNETFSEQLRQWLKWSYSTAFYPGESKFSTLLAHRINRTAGLEPPSGGKFQLTSYPEGVGYKTHTDCTEGNEDQRDRMGTILVYLNDVPEGGDTTFPKLGIKVKPRKGMALVWNNMDENGRCEPESIHHATKVVSGSKYILQRWYYYKSFYSLGRRPPEPSLPPRKAGQSRVSCDEYEHGSCRWYDEWNYDHILEYRRGQMTLV